MSTADRLASHQVLSQDGTPIRLETLWAERPAVLVWVRHFGWLFCKQQVAQLRGYVDRIRAAGAELYVIGNGSPEQARAFAADHDVRFPLYTDPSLASYDAAGFKNAASLSPSVFWKAAKAMAQGHFQYNTQGTATQNGGAFVFDRGGKELFAFRSKQAGDHPDPELLVAALGR